MGHSHNCKSHLLHAFLYSTRSESVFKFKFLCFVSALGIQHNKLQLDTMYLLKILSYLKEFSPLWSYRQWTLCLCWRYLSDLDYYSSSTIDSSPYPAIIVTALALVLVPSKNTIEDISYSTSLSLPSSYTQSPPRVFHPLQIYIVDALDKYQLNHN